MPELLLCIRKLSDYGSWHHYIAKGFGPAAERRSAWYLYSKMIYEHVRVVVKHTNRFREKATLVPSVILCMLTKYRWVPLEAIDNLAGKALSIAIAPSTMPSGPERMQL